MARPPQAGDPVVTLETAAANIARGAIGIRFTTDNADTAHAALQAAGVDADDILRWPGVPAMFAFRDPDGNAFSITETVEPLDRPLRRGAACWTISGWTVAHMDQPSRESPAAAVPTTREASFTCLVRRASPR